MDNWSAQNAMFESAWAEPDAMTLWIARQGSSPSLASDVRDLVVQGDVVGIDFAEHAVDHDDQRRFGLPGNFTGAKGGAEQCARRCLHVRVRKLRFQVVLHRSRPSSSSRGFNPALSSHCQ